MAIKVVSISQLIDKDLFSSPGKNINIRSSTNPGSTLLTTIKGGNRIGKVDTYAEGRDAKGNKDGSIWLQLKEKYSNPSGYGAWVKYMPDIFDWKALKEQGAQTIEEVKAEQDEKDKGGFDKVLDSLKEGGKWFLIGYFGLKLLESNKKKR